MFLLYQSYREAHRRMETLSDQLSDGQGFRATASPLPSEAAGDFIQRRMNHFPELEEAAQALWRQAGLDQDQLYPGLMDVFRNFGAKVRIHRAGEAPGILRRFDAESRVLSLSELLPLRSRAFQMAHQWCLLALGEQLDALVQDPLLADDTSRSMARVALANYFAGAVLMPYGPFLRATRAARMKPPL